MNNSLYTTISPEMECSPILSPEEEIMDYALTFMDDVDSREIFDDEPIHNVRNYVASVFLKGLNTQVNSIELHGEWGLEIPKKDTEFISEILNLTGIQYTLKDARFLNIWGHWTHKSFDLIVIDDNNFRVLARKLRNEIVIVGDDH
ncbi:MAG: hypothetical protein IJH63_02190 [Methanobrevibacter sp.]|nr:hypothetical protein [Methanobrevibacter sp.]